MSKSCYLCGKPITILDSTTSFIEPDGAIVEVHTACKRKLEAAMSASSDPALYTAEVELPPAADPKTSGSKRGWYLAAGAGAAIICGALLLGARR